MSYETCGISLTSEANEGGHGGLRFFALEWFGSGERNESEMVCGKSYKTGVFFDFFLQHSVDRRSA